MHRDNLKIAEPCGEDWDAMTGDEQRRHCEHCVKTVTDLSQMTEDEATSFLEGSADQNVCVRYSCDKDGRVHFKPSAEEASFWARLNQQRRGLATLMASSALVLTPLGLDDCRPLAPLFDDGASSTSGESLFQGTVMGDVDYEPPPPQQTPTATPEDTDIILMGKPAAFTEDEEAPSPDDAPVLNPMDKASEQPEAGKRLDKHDDDAPKAQQKVFKVTPDRKTVLGKVFYKPAPHVPRLKKNAR